MLLIACALWNQLPVLRFSLASTEMMYPPLQFNKKWLEHSKQFLIVLFKVTNSLVYGYINMMIFHHDVQRLSYSVQSGVFPQTVGQDKMPDETFEPYRKIAVIDEEGKIESPGIPPQGNSGERLETGSRK